MIMRSEIENLSPVKIIFLVQKERLKRRVEDRAQHAEKMKRDKN